MKNARPNAHIRFLRAKKRSAKIFCPQKKKAPANGPHATKIFATGRGAKDMPSLGHGGGGDDAASVMQVTPPPKTPRRGSASEPANASPQALIKQLAALCENDEEVDILDAVWMTPPPVVKVAPTIEPSTKQQHSIVLHSVLGSGSFAKVYLASYNGKPVAIKAIDRATVVKNTTVRRVYTELFVLRNHASPFLGKLHDTFKTRLSACLVLELQQGGELFELFRRKQVCFTASCVRFYAAECLLALEELHRLSVAYRDLKLENILLSASGHVVLSDYGLCRCNVDACDTGATSFVGSVEYIAPELLVDGSEHGWAVDWWALGVLIFELLDGLPPFYSSESQDETMYLIANTKPDLAGLPADAAETVAGLLDKNPATRLGSRPDMRAQDIKASAFFKDFPFAEAQSVPPPFVPALHGALDTRMFDSKFTSLPVCETAPAAGDTGPDALWPGFRTLDMTFA